MLETEPAMTVVAEAGTAEVAVALAAAGGADIVRMDPRFGSGMTGADAMA
ncbi:hypothetical protein [Pseudonocardia alni]